MQATATVQRWTSNQMAVEWSDDKPGLLIIALGLPVQRVRLRPEEARWTVGQLRKAAEDSTRWRSVTGIHINARRFPLLGFSAGVRRKECTPLADLLEAALAWLEDRT